MATQVVLHLVCTSSGLFGVEYVGEEHALHLVPIFKRHHKISEDWVDKKVLRALTWSGTMLRPTTTGHAADGGLYCRPAP